MTFDRNPEPVQFIQPNVLDRACLSVGQDGGLAGQFGLRRTVLIEDICKIFEAKVFEAKIFEAQCLTDGIAPPHPAEPSALSEAAQW